MTTVLILSLFYGAVPLAAQNREQRQITWPELNQVIGKKVRCIMPEGALIEGRAMAVQADALEVNITKTSNGAAYPKGKFLVPRATLHTLDVNKPTNRGKVIGLAVGGGIGVALAVLAVDFHSGLLSSTPISTAFAATAIAVPVGGYFLGRAADRRTITYVIAPEREH